MGYDAELSIVILVLNLSELVMPFLHSIDKDSFCAKFKYFCNQNGEKLELESGIWIDG